MPPVNFFAFSTKLKPESSPSVSESAPPPRTVDMRPVSPLPRILRSALPLIEPFMLGASWLMSAFRSVPMTVRLPPQRLFSKSKPAPPESVPPLVLALRSSTIM